MNEDLLKRLDLKLAWRRTKEDVKDWPSIDNPFELELIEQELSKWIKNLRNRLSGNNYQPQRCTIADVPKPNWHLRPISILKLEDSVVYNALLLDGISQIKEKLKWSERKHSHFNYKLVKEKK